MFDFFSRIFFTLSYYRISFKPSLVDKIPDNSTVLTASSESAQLFAY